MSLNRKRLAKILGAQIEHKDYLAKKLPVSSATHDHEWVLLAYVLSVFSGRWVFVAECHTCGLIAGDIQ